MSRTLLFLIAATLGALGMVLWPFAALAQVEDDMKPPPLAWFVEITSQDGDFVGYRVLQERPLTEPDVRSRVFPASATVRLIPVYPHPGQQPLTDRRIGELWRMGGGAVVFARRIEAEHGIPAKEQK